MQKLVSIIVPVYNVAKYLPRCLDSLVAQTLESIEILVINDGSTDESGEIIDAYAAQYPDKIVKFHRENQGVSMTRNFGMEQAKGKYIAFVDSDDAVVENMYEVLYNAAEEYNSDLVLCGRTYVETIGEEEKLSNWNQCVFDGSSNMFQLPKLLPDTSSFVWDKLFNRALIMQHGLRFDTELRYAEDAVFIYTYLFYADNVCSIPEPLYLYTVRREGSVTGALDERMMDEILACEKLTLFYLDTGYFTSNQSNLLWICVGLLMRKFADFHKISNSRLKYAFTTEMHKMLAKYYPQWAHYIRLYNTRGNKFKYKINFYKVHPFFLRLYIFSPNFLVSAAKKIIGVKSRLVNKARRIKKDLFIFRKRYRYIKRTVDAYLTARETSEIKENQIFYVCNSGDNIACNIYYLMQEAAQRGGYKIFIGSKNPRKDKFLLERNNLNIQVVKNDSPEFVNALATSKYLATNYCLPAYFVKRKEQVFLNTWHGTPLKYLGAHMQSGVSDIGNAQSQFLSSDFLLYPNQYTQERMMQGYFLDSLYTNTVLLTGYPRNAIFFEDKETERLKEKFGISGKRVYVYMPTWRGQTVLNRNMKYSALIRDILSEIDSKLDDDVILFVKLHNLAMKNITLHRYKRIRAFPDNMEIYSFLNLADCLITDYSSVFYDFANTQKEIILFAYDLEEYVETRGLYTAIENMPFTIIKETEELIEHMNSQQTFTPGNDYMQFLSEYCKYDSIDCAKRVNDVFLGVSADLVKGEKIPFYQSEKKCYTAYLAPNFETEEEMLLFQMHIREDAKALVVFHQQAFTPYTQEFIQYALQEQIPCVVAQAWCVGSVKERIYLNLYRKWGWFKNKAKKYCEREAERLFPSLMIEKYVNMSERALFQDFEDLLN